MAGTTLSDLYAAMAGVVPAGVICMWSGTLASIPTGWALCDGGGGRPDLRDKFIKGWAAGVDPGGTGGAATHTHAAHSYTPAGTNAAIAASATAGALLTISAGSDVAVETHTHPAPAFTGTPASLTHDTPNSEPPYYKLAFIIKT